MAALESPVAYTDMLWMVGAGAGSDDGSKHNVDGVGGGNCRGSGGSGGRSNRDSGGYVDSGGGGDGQSGTGEDHCKCNGDDDGTGAGGGDGNIEARQTQDVAPRKVHWNANCTWFLF